MDEISPQMVSRRDTENVELKPDIFARKILFVRGRPKHFFLIKIGEDFYWNELVCTKISYSRFTQVGLNNVHKIYDLHILFKQRFYETRCVIDAVQYHL